MRVISASHTKLITYVDSNFTLNLRCRHINGFSIQAWDTFYKVSCPSTIGMRNLIAVTLYQLTSAQVLTNIKVYARYLSYNYCLSIWVINANWTSVHNCLCLSVSISLSHLNSPLVVRACAVWLLFAAGRFHWVHGK